MSWRFKAFGASRRGKANPPRIRIRCICCGREALVPRSHVTPPRSNVHLCGRSACHAVWKSAIANAFDLHTCANFTGVPA